MTLSPFYVQIVEIFLDLIFTTQESFQENRKWKRRKKYKKVIDNRKIRAYNATHTKQTKPIKIV